MKGGRIRKPPRLPKSAPKVTLTVVAGPGAGQTVELSRCVTLVGTRRGCKLLLKSTSISSVHCAIINTGEEVYLRDLVSTTGTLLNSLKAQCEKLDDGDTIIVGDWELRVRISAYTVDTLSDLPHVSLEPEPSAFGVELNGAGQFIKLNRPVGMVGRKVGCDVVIDDKRVSRAHMLLFTYLGQPVFYDLLSNNGVVLEGRLEHFGVLHSGDILSLGPKALRMILPGVGRRQKTPLTGDSTGGSVDLEARGIDASRYDLDDTGDGTVVQLAEEEGDRIDIRLAELDRE